MKIYTCLVSGQEFISDAKKINEDVPGMLWVETANATEGGVSVDTGGGNAFGGGADEDVDDAEETKLDHFWQFPELENEITFKNFKAFRKDYYIYFVNACKRLMKEGKVPDESKDTLKDNLKLAMEWIKENFDSLQFFSIPTYVDTYDEYPDEEGDGSVFGANMMMLLYNEEGARCYFVKGAFNVMKV
eukprot:CAMPEP_0185581740 /NCGR_PEP_ID=MMETSP0434-20130131/18865_1 /TAXON_ID=626734 ORGANISM="Favella taraikaensis, Strain Fe Narragansett Bay" /NCGR_SAMPLE_ID=MMETSP0434 /ASSEMBLY_ACC=CAM_ASM_000379 /LENGTH=187 /DNA_ID=CAMNT_0028200353 /DNA_START=35 /DNA_END=598 /DNA_ORIENTATION=+